MELAVVIPLHRCKLVSFAAAPARLAIRLATAEKWPLAIGLRHGRSRSRWGINAVDGLGDLGTLKYAQRAQRRTKLRLFRVFKLFGELKRGERPASYRALPERLRSSRWLRRG